MDPLDEHLKAAMQGLEKQASDRYFDELPGRIMARLEESMQSDVNRPGTSAAGQSAVGSNGKPERQEDSGLHDIRALAETTKQRMSQRKIPTVNPPVDHDVLNASSASLRAVALPEPAKMVSLEIPASLAAGTSPARAIRDSQPAMATGAATATAASFSAVPPRSKAPMIIAGTVAFAAAAGAVGYFGFMKEKDKADPGGPTRIAAETTAATVTPIETAPAAAPTPAPTGAAAVAGSAPIGGGDSPAAASGAALIANDTDDKAAAGDDAADKSRRDKRDDDKTDKADKAAKDKADKAIAPTAPGKKDDLKKDDAKKPGGDTKATGGDTAKPAPGPADKQEQSLDDLLKGAGVDTSAPKEEKPKLEKKGLDAGDIRKTMSALNGRAQGCYAKFGVTGSVAVKLTVDPSGQVKKTVVTGAAAGTPSGDCVSEIAATASFPPWDGAPMTVNYSYFLSE